MPTGKYIFMSTENGVLKIHQKLRAQKLRNSIIWEKMEIDNCLKLRFDFLLNFFANAMKFDIVSIAAIDRWFNCHRTFINFFSKLEASIKHLNPFGHQCYCVSISQRVLLIVVIKILLHLSIEFFLICEKSPLFEVHSIFHLILPHNKYLPYLLNFDSTRTRQDSRIHFPPVYRSVALAKFYQNSSLSIVF